MFARGFYIRGDFAARPLRLALRVQPRWVERGMVGERLSRGELGLRHRIRCCDFMHRRHGLGRTVAGLGGEANLQQKTTHVLQ